MSTNKTRDYDLNQWVLSDKPVMDEFNEDNKKIDTALGDIDSQLSKKVNLAIYVDPVNGSDGNLGKTDKEPIKTFKRLSQLVETSSAADINIHLFPGEHLIREEIVFANVHQVTIRPYEENEEVIIRIRVPGVRGIDISAVSSFTLFGKGRIIIEPTKEQANIGIIAGLRSVRCKLTTEEWTFDTDGNHPYIMYMENGDNCEYTCRGTIFKGDAKVAIAGGQHTSYLLFGTVAPTVEIGVRSTEPSLAIVGRGFDENNNALQKYVKNRPGALINVNGSFI